VVVRWEVSGVRVSSGDFRSLWDIAVCTQSVPERLFFSCTRAESSHDLMTWVSLVIHSLERARYRQAG
jgi:hypothetical protein